MSGKANFYMIIKILLRIGHISFCRLLERYVFLRRPETVLSPDEWTVDHFLHENLARIIETTTGHRNAMIFIPGFNQRTDLAAWSIHMLCFVLSDICIDLPEDVSRSIDDLKEIREKLCFREEVLSDDELQQMVSRLKRIFSCLAEYSRENVQQAIDQINVEIDEYLRAPLAKTEQQKFFTYLVEWHNDEKDHREKVREVPQELKTITEKIVSVRKTPKAVPPREEANLKIPVAKIVLQPKAKTPHQSLNVSKRLATAFQGAQSTSIGDLEREVKQVIKTLQSEDLHLSHVERGCIELHIQCSNIESFTKLIEDCVSGKLLKKFEPVEEAIRQQEGFAEYTQELFMYKDDFDNCMIELANNIDDYLTDNEMNDFVLSQREINMIQSVSNSCENITLTVKSSDEDDLLRFKQFNEDGRLHKTFERLSTVLNRTYGTDEVSLNVAMEQLPNVNMQREEPLTAKDEEGLEIPRVAFELVTSVLLIYGWLYTSCL